MQKVNLKNMDYPRYDTYKDSRIEWLGEIPTHWEVKRVKSQVHTNLESLGSDTPSDFVLRYLDITNVDNTGFIGELQEMEFYDAPSRARRIVRNKNVVLSTVRPNLQGLACFDEVPDNLIASTGFAVLQVKGSFSSKYLYYQCLSNYFKAQMESTAVGVSYPAVNSTDVECIRLMVPPLQEQTAIADFLNEQTARIDRLIQNKETQIERLKELRQITITKAVTKGLNPDEPVKDSGIEWLGEIPAHWEIVRFRNHVKNLTIKGRSEELPFIALEYIISGNGQLLKEFEWEIVKGDDNVIFDQRHILYGKLRPYLQKYFRPDHRGCCPTELLVFEPRKKLLRDFFYYFVQTHFFNSYTDSASYGVKMPRTSWEKIGALQFYIPSKKEQTAIADFLDEQTAQIDRLIENNENQIERLKEYRKIVIHNAVTGKWKVCA